MISRGRYIVGRIDDVPAAVVFSPYASSWRSMAKVFDWNSVKSAGFFHLSVVAITEIDVFAYGGASELLSNARPTEDLPLLREALGFQIPREQKTDKAPE